MLLAIENIIVATKRNKIRKGEEQPQWGNQFRSEYREVSITQLKSLIVYRRRENGLEYVSGVHIFGKTEKILF